MDLNCNGILDECERVGTRYCSPQNVNSSGGSAYIVVTGTNVVADNDLMLTACGAPEGELSYFVTAPASGYINLPALGLSSGFFCQGNGNGRILNQTMPTGPGGTFYATVDLANVPQSTGPRSVYSVMSGDTMYFQRWFRDCGSSPANNFTDAICVTFI